jgi:hypothetical protein
VDNGHEAIVQYICTHHANCASIPDTYNIFLFHYAMWKKANVSIVKLVYEAYPQAISTCNIEGRLPIHYLLSCGNFNTENDLVTNKLRFILSKCPDCVNIPDSPLIFQTPRTAYELSLSQPTFVQRLMLLAKPEMNLQLYRELNYNARRMGMFLGFTANTADGSQCFYHRMQIKNFDCFRVIISYL